MKNLDFYRGKKVLILGYGVSGQGAERLARTYGMEAIPVDERTLDHGIGNFTGDTRLPGAALAVVSPGIRMDSRMYLAARESAEETIGELEFASRAFQGKIIGITGTNGKTTTTELTTKLFRAAGFRAEAAGNIGLSLSDAVQQKDLEYLIVECSSFQLETIQDFSPEAGAFLNLASDHINRHGSLENYGRTKANLFRNFRKGDKMILNTTLPPFVLSSLPADAEKITFSASGKADFTLEGSFLTFRGKKIIQREELPLEGMHNVENVLASLALLYSCAGEKALFTQGIRDCIRSFRPDAHRMEFFLEKNEIRFADDSKATNPHSVNAFLKSCGGKKNVVLLLGGLDKGMDFSSILEDAEHIKCAVCFGECGKKIFDVLKETIPCTLSPGSFEETVAEAVKKASPGDIVALSPACASMDMFKNYAERGDIFQELCRKLAN